MSNSYLNVLHFDLESSNQAYSIVYRIRIVLFLLFHQKNKVLNS